MLTSRLILPQKGTGRHLEMVNKASKSVKKPASRKASRKRPVAKKSAPKKKVVAKKATKKKPALKKVAPKKKAVVKKAAKKKSHLTPSEKRKFKADLISLRERLTGQIATLKHESLTRQDSVNSEEDGTDAFDREFALNLVSSEHDSLVKIDNALRRIGQGTYGQCEECGKSVEKPRLQALPFVSNCIRCQSAAEKNRPKYRPVEARESF